MSRPRPSQSKRMKKKRASCQDRIEIGIPHVILAAYTASPTKFTLCALWISTRVKTDTYENTHDGAYEEAYDDVYEKTYDNAYDDAYEKAYDDAYEKAYDDAYEKAYDEAYEKAYEK